jgi:hypothetical protein
MEPRGLSLRYACVCMRSRTTEVKSADGLGCVACRLCQQAASDAETFVLFFSITSCASDHKAVRLHRHIGRHASATAQRAYVCDRDWVLRLLEPEPQLQWIRRRRCCYITPLSVVEGSTMNMIVTLEAIATTNAVVILDGSGTESRTRSP